MGVWFCTRAEHVRRPTAPVHAILVREKLQRCRERESRRPGTITSPRATPPASTAHAPPIKHSALSLRAPGCPTELPPRAHERGRPTRERGGLRVSPRQPGPGPLRPTSQSEHVLRSLARHSARGGVRRHLDNSISRTMSVGTIALELRQRCRLNQTLHV